MTDHPINPPLELALLWIGLFESCLDENVFSLAAQWGADQELEACCEWLDRRLFGRDEIRQLHAFRRPKPPSLKEQALKALELLQQRTTDPNIVEPLRRALEQLND
jgi:hypothetical protein